jgi:hypothetical protein
LKTLKICTDIAQEDISPVYIGNNLNNGRYQEVDKLGYGGYSAIWLARDHQTLDMW